MRPGRRTLRELLTDVRMTPEERADQCAERCLEAVFEEGAPPDRAWEREEEAVEAERRRWTTPRS